MHANITHPDRALPLDKSWRSRATDEEVARVTRAMSAYCGPYKVSRRDGDVILSTKAEISLEPSWIGTIQERKVGFGERDGEKTMILKPVEPLQLPVCCPSSSLSQSYVFAGREARIRSLYLGESGSEEDCDAVRLVGLEEVVFKYGNSSQFYCN